MAIVKSAGRVMRILETIAAGDCAAAYATATGKAILAYRPEDEI